MRLAFLGSPVWAVSLQAPIWDKLFKIWLPFLRFSSVCFDQAQTAASVSEEGSLGVSRDKPARSSREQSAISLGSKAKCEVKSL